MKIIFLTILLFEHCLFEWEYTQNFECKSQFELINGILKHKGIEFREFAKYATEKDFVSRICP